MTGMSHSEAGKIGREKSAQTQLIQYQKRLESYEENPTLCANCNKALDYEHRTNRFCSNNCAAIYNNNQRVLRMPIAVCQWCQKEYRVGKSSLGKFCSLSCHAKYKSAQKIKDWLEGNESSLDTDGGIKSHIRIYLIELADRKCQECGWDKINIHTGKTPLEIHHIDGNPENNKFENLKVICPNCHALTDNYKGRNKGQGRQKRMQRYRDGKTY